MRAKYTYDAWGNVTSITDENGNAITSQTHVGNLNPFRYRGYYQDAETGFYYLMSRYYDTVTHRFVNADGYFTTGLNPLEANMNIYCGNNPVMCADPTGESWEEIGVFLAGFAVAVWAAMVEFSPAYAGCAGLAAADGPLPFGDALGITGAIVITAVAVGRGVYQATQSNSTSISIPKVEEKEKSTEIPIKPKSQAFFTTSPYDFHPKGLFMKEYPGTYNGRIIEWVEPISNKKVFEWNEDYAHGAHYHVIMVEWDGKHNGLHYTPGTPVPEPWNSMYFGG